MFLYNKTDFFHVFVTWGSNKSSRWIKNIKSPDKKTFSFFEGVQVMPLLKKKMYGRSVKFSNVHIFPSFGN